MLVVVTKPFTVNGIDFIRNQLVDGSQFPKVQQLVAQHYVRAATADEIATATYEDEPEPEPVKQKTKLRIRRRSR